jgi:hypothetical protein
MGGNSPERFIKQVEFEKTVVLKGKDGQPSGCTLTARVVMWRQCTEAWDKDAFRAISAAGRKRANDVLKDELRDMNATKEERIERERMQARDVAGEYLDIGVY